MEIDAFTCCVGPVYANYLRQSLPIWMDTLDSLTVVTKPEDKTVIDVCNKYRRIRVVTTDVFGKFGAAFNKGAALNVAYAAMDPHAHVLHFDSDIMPQTNWRKIAEKNFKPGTIAGARRYDEKGKLIVDHDPWPYGYFQMWNANDPACQCWPMFDTWHSHAGNYDVEFLEKWPKARWVDLGFRVTHFGEVRQNWFGVGLPANRQQQSFERMKELHKKGLRQVAIEARAAEKRLAVPDYKLKLVLDSHDRPWQRLMLRACMTSDPFLVTAIVGPGCPGWETLTVHDSVEYLRDRVARLAKEST